MLRKTLMIVSALTLLASPALAQDQAEIAPVGASPSEESPSEAAPASVPAEENILLLDLSTGGRVTIQLFPDVAPNHVKRIKTLARQGFYDGIIFHRVIDGFMAQTGDPTGTGAGGSSLPDLKAEFHPFPHVRGVVSMARADSEDSANSQFFIIFYPRFALDNKYTVFGRVTGGMQYVDAIHRGEPPASPTRILQASVAFDGKAPPLPGARVGVAEKEITIDDLNAPIKP
ncbi:Peptidyl-prolyl cis-trans isomerase [hydrothermal vent metagenome]|uniref:peptidylprolyl isomerase n=1 Tax=hydrothermal vent metagenome TaxID=652676 RepID=A0A3B0RVD5_9ZZZZ